MATTSKTIGLTTVADTLSQASPPNWDFVARATALRPLVRAQAAEAESARRLTDEAADAIHQAGLLNIVVPEKLGGQGQSFRTMFEALTELSRGDASAGWVAALMNASTWFATLFSDEAQHDVFGANPSAKLCAIFAPGERSERVEGGYRISGAWAYGSGSAWADWALLGLVLGELPDGTPDLGLALVPRDQLQTKDTWYVAGMCATASNTLLGDDVFVPSHRIHSFAELANENYARTDDSHASSRASFAPGGTVIGAGPLVGAARAALDLTLEKAPDKPIAYTQFTAAKDSPAHQLGLAKAATEIDLAHLIVSRAAADIDLAAERHEKLSPFLRGRAKADVSKAAELSRSAVGRLLTVNGASSFATVNPLNRIWRDVEVAGRHGFILPELADLQYGRLAFGIDEPIIAY